MQCSNLASLPLWNELFWLSLHWFLFDCCSVALLGVHWTVNLSPLSSCYGAQRKEKAEVEDRGWGGGGWNHKQNDRAMWELGDLKISNKRKKNRGEKGAIWDWEWKWNETKPIWQFGGIAGLVFIFVDIPECVCVREKQPSACGAEKTRF